jgi:hypothetical protein
MVMKNNVRVSLASVKIANAMVVSNRMQLALFAGIAIAFWIAFSVLDQLLFFYPFFDFYLPADALPNFILSIATSVLMGLVVSMNVYILRTTKFGKKKISTSIFSGTSVGMITSACASCTSLSFLLVSTFGWAGVIASNVLSDFQIPLRLVSIGLLAWALYSSSKKITVTCVTKEH